LYPDLNAVQNLQFAASLYMDDLKKIKETIHHILDLVELQNRAKGRVETYSGGMNRLLALMFRGAIEFGST